MGQIAPVAIGLAFVGLNSLITSKGRSNTVRNTVEGSKIDTATPTAEFGSSVDIFYGTVKKNACPTMWAQPLRQEKIETERVETSSSASAGKGQGSQKTTTITTEVTFNYYLTAAFLIGGEIQEIRRVWLNGILVYSFNSEATDTSQTFLDKIAIYTGTMTQGVDSTIQSFEGEVPALRGKSYIVFDDYPLSEFDGNGFPLVDIELIGEEANNPQGDQQWCYIYDVLPDLLSKAGLPESRIDTSLLGIENVNLNLPGYILSSGKTWRSVLEELQQLFFLIVIESEDKVRFYHQREMVLQEDNIILERFLGGGVEDNRVGYIQKMLNPESVYSSANIDFLDVGRAFRENSVTFYNPSYTHNNSLDLQTPASLTSGQASDVADRILSESETQNIVLENITLLPTWSTLNVGDLFVLVKENEDTISQIYQITQRTRGVNFLVNIQAVRYKGAIVVEQINDIPFDNNPLPSSSPPIPVATYTSIKVPDVAAFEPSETIQPTTPPEETSNYGSALTIPLDIPLINDSDVAPLLYVAVQSIENWNTGILYSSDDNESTYDFARNLFFRSLVGTVAIALPDHATAVFDRTNTIRVAMTDNTSTIPTATNEQFLKGQSYLILGSEIIAFRDVEVVSSDPLTYDISYLKRGHRGTEYYTDQHTTNETLIILSEFTARVASSQNLVNRTLNFKAVGSGQVEPNVTNSSSIMVQGNSIKPYPPFPVVGDRSGNDLIITWYRRTRVSGGLVDYAEIGFAGGELRQYQLEILNGLNTVRTVTVTDSEAYTYTEAQQVNDFGSAQSSVDVRIWQLSSYPVALNEAKVVNL
ncbi:phage tail protein [Crocosphaera sp.]|uniref:GTA baseplate fiber-binding domain-containing protein n=1 Tax=Crocosphaera sp. TaxID=2729996 RepID=UPI00262A43B8|nr:phage tail protein [Crocosphaera sp.]MDJ0579100.1 phage tail protein [Crocosphaera sp.]